jgi:hypothetical protein
MRVSFVYATNNSKNFPSFIARKRKKVKLAFAHTTDGINAVQFKN